MSDWRNRAECRDEDPELFFPVGTGPEAAMQVEEAKAVCRRCPVQSECLDVTLGLGQQHGVWANLSEDERGALKRRMSRQAARAAARAS